MVTPVAVHTGGPRKVVMVAFLYQRESDSHEELS